MPTQQPLPLHCPKCRTTLVAEHDYCGKCGVRGRSPEFERSHTGLVAATLVIGALVGAFAVALTRQSDSAPSDRSAVATVTATVTVERTTEVPMVLPPSEAGSPAESPAAQILTRGCQASKKSMGVKVNCVVVEITPKGYLVATASYCDPSDGLTNDLRYNWDLVAVGNGIESESEQTVKTEAVVTRKCPRVRASFGKAGLRSGQFYVSVGIENVTNNLFGSGRSTIFSR